MGVHVNRLATTVAAGTVVVLITAMNVFLIYQQIARATARGWAGYACWACPL